ncbi:MAG: hypothetical protein GWN18_19580 [Thermoplasmata archaeon]|nr:hypothetical protein [Thermoplasmata archaeon]NIS14343.1 hypothetical protein [Thermoplasmata archaeon]NIS22169.1 hypothetical protein [Thermoplasmata archaeon]NIT80056.1 hypothetical protein [Thermoplasmata archaeon]NIU51186.1 hypothetical protein [Thermoplasmata archaeon]
MYKLYTETRNADLDCVDCNTQVFESFATARLEALTKAREEGVQKAVVNDAKDDLIFDAIADKYRQEELNEEIQSRIKLSTLLAQARVREERRVFHYPDGDPDTDIAVVVSIDQATEWLENGGVDIDLAEFREALEDLVRRDFIVTQEYRLVLSRRITASSEDEAREIAEDEDAIYRIDLSDGWEEEDCYHEDTTVEEDY